MKSFVWRYRWFMAALSTIIVLIITREIVESEWVVPPAQRTFTGADFDTILHCVTEKEVIEALGPPIGELPAENYRPEMWMRSMSPLPPGSTLKEWVSETGVIWVYFDEEGKVHSCSFGKPRPPKESFFQRLLKKVGLK